MQRRAPSGLAGSLTTWSLAALAAGLALGLLLHRGGGGPLAGLPALIGPVGQLWLNALQITVLPLVVTQMLVAIMGGAGGHTLGSLGGRALILFLTLLVAAGIFTLAVAPPMIALYPADPDAAAAMRAATSVPAAAAGAADGSGGDWLSSLLPGNLIQAAADGDVLPLLLFTILFGLAATRLPDDSRRLLAGFARAAADAMMQLVRWILVVTPVGVFALSLELAAGAGLGAAGFMAAFVVIVSIAMLLFTAVLYPVTTLAGRVPLRAFAAATAPAQLVAVSTRSSIASLPALVEGARDRLRLSEAATGLALPLSVSVFKINRTISSTVKLLFMAYAFGIPIGAGALATFVVTVIILSFSSVGVPGGGSAFRTLPAYLAAGAPIEAVVILEAVDTIPDIFKTLLNVTGDMSVAAILTRGDRVPGLPAPAAVPVAGSVPAPP